MQYATALSLVTGMRIHLSDEVPPEFGPRGAGQHAETDPQATQGRAEAQSLETAHDGRP